LPPFEVIVLTSKVKEVMNMASPGPPEATFNSHEAQALKPSISIPKLSEYSVPSQQGNSVIHTAEASRANSVDGLPSMHIAGADSTTTALKNLGTTEALTGGTGAVAGAAAYGLVGKVFGSIAELVFKAAPGASLSLSDELALNMAKTGAAEGGLIGLAAGALAFGCYEVLKQSAEHPDRAPDLAVLS
jgi:hypothetical protein